MRFPVRASSLVLAAALAFPALPAFADDVVEPAVIETAKLDPAVIEDGAALELFGLSSAASTALVFVLIAIVVTVATNNGDSQGVPP